MLGSPRLNTKINDHEVCRVGQNTRTKHLILLKRTHIISFIPSFVPKFCTFLRHFRNSITTLNLRSLKIVQNLGLGSFAGVNIYIYILNTHFKH